MSFLPPKALRPEERTLLRMFGELAERDRDTLLAFAEFLTQRGSERVAAEQATVPEPKPCERPAEETVIAAVKRLSASYHMLDRNRMFHETAALMTSHVVQGRPANEVIDDLEKLFEEHYRKLATETNGHGP